MSYKGKFDVAKAEEYLALLVRALEKLCRRG